MDASCSKDISISVVVANLAKLLLNVMNQFIQKHQKQTVILII